MLLRRQVPFLFCALLPLVLPAQEAFEGTWKMDAKKSPSGQFAPENLQQEIEVDGPKIKIKSKFAEPTNGVYPLIWVGIMTSELALSANGSQTVNHIGPFTHNSKTTMEGANKMVTDFTATLENGSVTGQWVRTLSDNGKDLTLLINAKASDGRTANLTLLFKKK